MPPRDMNTHTQAYSETNEKTWLSQKVELPGIETLTEHDTINHVIWSTSSGPSLCKEF